MAVVVVDPTGCAGTGGGIRL